MSKIGAKWILHGLLEGSGEHLGPKSSQALLKDSRGSSLDPSPLDPQDGAMLEGFGAMLGVCWQTLEASLGSEGHLSQHSA